MPLKCFTPANSGSRTKRAGFLPANGPAAHRACCPAAPLPGEGKVTTLSQPRQAPSSCKDIFELQKGHPPRTALRAPHCPWLTAEPYGSVPRRAPRNRDKRRCGRATTPSPKLSPSKATPVPQAGYKQGGTRLPEPGPARVPCIPSHSPGWETSLCRRLWEPPTPVPNTAGSKRPWLPGGKGEHRHQPELEPSETTPKHP